MDKEGRPFTTSLTVVARNHDVLLAPLGEIENECIVNGWKIDPPIKKILSDLRDFEPQQRAQC